MNGSRIARGGRIAFLCPCGTFGAPHFPQGGWGDAGRPLLCFCPRSSPLKTAKVPLKEGQFSRFFVDFWRKWAAAACLSRLLAVAGNPLQKVNCIMYANELLQISTGHVLANIAAKTAARTTQNAAKTHQQSSSVSPRNFDFALGNWFLVPNFGGGAGGQNLWILSKLSAFWGIH